VIVFVVRARLALWTNTSNERDDDQTYDRKNVIEFLNECSIGLHDFATGGFIGEV
jgi:hypothetical protein